MQQVLLVVQIFAGIGLIAVVLLQHGKGADAGASFGAGSGGGVFGAGGPASLLTRVTAVLATVFFLNSLGLAYSGRLQSLESRSVMGRFESSEQPGAPPSDVPVLGQGTGADVPAAAGSAPADVPKTSDQTSTQ